MLVLPRLRAVLPLPELFLRLLVVHLQPVHSAGLQLLLARSFYRDSMSTSSMARPRILHRFRPLLPQVEGLVAPLVDSEHLQRVVPEVLALRHHPAQPQPLHLLLQVAAGEACKQLRKSGPAGPDFVSRSSCNPA